MATTARMASPLHVLRPRVSRRFHLRKQNNVQAINNFDAHGTVKEKLRSGNDLLVNILDKESDREVEESSDSEYEDDDDDDRATPIVVHHEPFSFFVPEADPRSSLDSVAANAPTSQRQSIDSTASYSSYSNQSINYSRPLSRPVSTTLPSSDSILSSYSTTAAYRLPPEQPEQQYPSELGHRINEKRREPRLAGPSPLTTTNITYEETQVGPRAEEAAWEAMIDRIVASDYSLIKPDSPQGKKKNKQVDPFAPPPALLPKRRTEKEEELAKKRLTVEASAKRYHSIALNVHVVLERRRWVWRKTERLMEKEKDQDIIPEPVTPVLRTIDLPPTDKEGSDAELWNLTIKDHKDLVQEAQQSQKGIAKLRFTFPIVAPRPCKSCHGKGTVICQTCDGIEADTCFWCEGSGKMKYKERLHSSCKRCNGSGKYCCSDCENASEKECGDCKGKAVVPSELGCVIEVKIVKLPPISINEYSTEQEREELLESICDKINTLFPMPASPENSPRLGGNLKLSNVSGSGSRDDDESASASSSSNHGEGMSAATPSERIWYPIAAHCILEKYQSTTVVVSRPSVARRKSFLAYKKKKEKGGAEDSSTGVKVAGVRSSQYIVPNCSKMPVQKMEIAIGTGVSV